MSIERLDPGDEEAARQVADLHSRYLGDSPIVQFGPAFLRKFYYRSLVRDGLVGVSLYRDDGRVVGFISYTLEPLGFMLKGIRRHPIQLAWALLTGVIQRPATARDILKILRVMRERSGDEQAGATEDTGEVISLVVDSEYRGHVPPDGEARLAVRLFEDAVGFFREHGLRDVHLLVRPDNMESNLFCASMGCAFGKISYGGETVHRYTYEIPAPRVAGEVGS